MYKEDFSFLSFIFGAKVEVTPVSLLQAGRKIEGLYCSVSWLPLPGHTAPEMKFLGQNGASSSRWVRYMYVCLCLQVQFQNKGKKSGHRIQETGEA